MSSPPTELDDDTALFTDLYELTMAASYFAEGMDAPATFSFFIRRYPPGRGFFVAAGLDDVLRYLEGLRFSPRALDYLRETKRFSPEFLGYLATLRFTGDVHALAEGTVCFVDEPLLEVTAPLIEAQIIETFVINQMHLQTMLASKAARCIYAAAGRPVIDFSLRRAHGTDAGMQIARCSYLAGAAGTSNVLAGMRWGLPIFGTMAHAYVEAFENEPEAFAAFARAFPAGSTLLVDTYDTLEGVRRVIPVAHALREKGYALQAVRLDSGDLNALSRASRVLLDAAGLQDVKIFVSGGLDEHVISALLDAGAPVDAFGVGTSMGVSADAPWLDCVYKLVEYAGRPRLKLSSDKRTWAGRKQVWRVRETDGFTRDCLSLRDEVAPLGGGEHGRVEALLQPVMRAGRVLQPRPALDDSRARLQAQLARLPEPYKDLRAPQKFPLAISPALAQCQQQAEARATAAPSSGGRRRPRDG